eukprot:SAG25_NODE_539_length_7086_cov_2.350937_3_plen_56_part_00
MPLPWVACQKPFLLWLNFTLAYRGESSEFAWNPLFCAPVVTIERSDNSRASFRAQ